MKKTLIVLTVVLALISIVLIDRLENFDLAYKEEIHLTFTSDGNKLSGSLYLPETAPPYDVVFFIHGDGAEDRTANGAYTFIMNHLLEEGIACFSYDKAGVARSEGNWLEQTMKDRSLEVEAGLEVLRRETPINKVGVLGFSQGGWVLSELAQSDATVDFYIVVGGAIDWLDQHMYYERKVADSRGYSKADRQAYLSYVKAYDALILQNDYEAYAAYVSSRGYEEPMDKERFHFAAINARANAREGIYHMQAPFLGVFGAEDQNVDIQESYTVYQEVFEEIGKQNYELHILPDATHGLLKSKYEDKEALLVFHSFLLGEKIFADGFLDRLSEWIISPE